MAGIIHYEVYVWQNNNWELLGRYPSDQKMDALDYAKDIELKEFHATKVTQETYDPLDKLFKETVIYVSKIPTTPPKRQYHYSGGNFASASVQKTKTNAVNMTNGMITLFLTMIFSILLSGIITAAIMHLLASSDLVPAFIYKQIVLGMFTVFFLLISVPLSIKWVNWRAFSQVSSKQVSKKSDNTSANIDSQDLRNELYEMTPVEDEDATEETNGNGQNAGTEGIAQKNHRPSFLFNAIKGFFNLFDIITGKQPFTPPSKEEKTEKPAEEKKPEETQPEKDPEQKEEPVQETQEKEPEEISETVPAEITEEEIEQNEPEKTIVIPPELESNYMKMTAFFAILLRVLQSRSILLNTYNRFGLELFLAGACECLCQEDKLTPDQNRLILAGLLTTLGRTPTLADIFYYKMDEYTLEPKYLPMIQSGTDAMRIYLENSSSPELISLFQEAMNNWINPDQKEAPASGICTVMFTDMVSSTHITQVLGDSVAQQLVRAHNTIVRNALHASGGTEIKHTGDGIMASFLWASNAVDAAIAIQKEVSEYNSQFPTMPLQIRIGLNSGEPIVEDNDLFGQTVQMASRVCGQAGADQIYVSSVVKELSAGKNYVFKALGDFSLKGIDEPQQLYEVVWNAPVSPATADGTGAEAANQQIKASEKETALSETLKEF